MSPEVIVLAYPKLFVRVGLDAVGEGETVILERRQGNIFIALGRPAGLESRFDVLPTLSAPATTRRD